MKASQERVKGNLINQDHEWRRDWLGLKGAISWEPSCYTGR